MVLPELGARRHMDQRGVIRHHDPAEVLRPLHVPTERCVSIPVLGGLLRLRLLFNRSDEITAVERSANLIMSKLRSYLLRQDVPKPALDMAFFILELVVDSSALQRVDVLPGLSKELLSHETPVLVDQSLCLYGLDLHLLIETHVEELDLEGRRKDLLGSLAEGELVDIVWLVAQVSDRLKALELVGIPERNLPVARARKDLQLRVVEEQVDYLSRVDRLILSEEAL